MDLVERLVRGERLTEEELEALILLAEKEDRVRSALTEEADRIRRRIYGTDVYIRGLVEFTNYCGNDCYYCGIRRSNRKTVRYRLTKEEILACCEQGYGLGFRTFVLQGGEDGYYNDERLTDIIRAIRSSYPDCAVTLSVGERTYDSYKRLREAGADRYLLRHEAADEWLYGSLHPEEQKLYVRKRCLYDLKELGYQVGAGFMVGAPGQTVRHLAKDLVFLRELRPQMVGIGPFIPHHETRYAKEPAGSIDRTLLLLSMIRILLPAVLLPATTALGTLEESGRERGILSGANVVMPNLSPKEKRKYYELYDNKLCTGEEAAESVEDLAARMEKIGFRIVTDRGDYKAPEGLQ